MNSKIENLARRRRKFLIWNERPLCVHKARVKIKNLVPSRHSQKPTFEFICVYMSQFYKSLLCVFCMCFFWPFIKADDLDPASAAYLSDKKYAKHVEVKAYLVTKAQVATIFNGENTQIIQKTNKELFGQELYLLVRCKNTGDYAAFGILNCNIRSSNESNTDDSRRGMSIEIMMMPGYMKSFHDSVLYIGVGTVPNDSHTPIVRYTWKSLYTM